MSETTATVACDVCGKPATLFAIDVLEGDGGDGWLRSIPFGPMKHGCDEHPVESAGHRTEGIIQPDGSVCWP